MGTRSLTIMYDAPWGNNEPEEIAVLYRQYDGYPEGHGEELASFLSDFTVMNGYNSTEGKIANRGTCLSAQIVAHFKDGVGLFYLHPAGTRDAGEEYKYYVYPKVGDRIRMKVESGYGEEWEQIFDGYVEDFIPENMED